jgi:polyisoprenoid-binding protein YceI
VLVSASSLLTLTMTPAAPAELSLTPAATEVGIRLWGMGVLPVDGTFRQFSGTIAYTQPDFAQCDVNLTVQVESLAMADQARRDEMLSPNFLDAARFPTLIYRGACRSSTSIDGTLAMRGTTHPLPLKLSHTDHELTAEGNLDRTVWGMTAKPFIVARTVRIRIIARLP